MLRSFCSPYGSTATVGGSGGEEFTFYEEGHHLKSLELRCGEKTNQQIQGLVATLSNGATASFGTVKEKGQIPWLVELQLNETVSSLSLYGYKQGCGGVVLKTSVGVHILGHVMGTAAEMKFSSAKLLGILGKAGDDIDRLGFYYADDNANFYLPTALPEQRYVWKSDQGQPRLTTSLFQPFQKIQEMELSYAQNELTGVSVLFSNETQKSAGECKNPADVKIQWPKDGLIRAASVKKSNLGTVCELHLEAGLVANEANDDPSVKRWVNINAHLVAVHLGWTDQGTVNAVALLFSSPAVYSPIGHLPDPSGEIENFESIQFGLNLHSVFSYVKEEAIRGIGFSFTNGVDIVRGDKETDAYSSATFPLGANGYTVKTKKGSGNNAERIASIHFETPQTHTGQPWSAFLGHPNGEDGGAEVNVKGSVIGAWGHSENALHIFGVISTAPCSLTPICGLLQKGDIFETDCLYSAKREEVMQSVVCIRSWSNFQFKFLNGLQIQRAAAQSDAVYVTDVGTLNGKCSKIEIPSDFKVKEIRVGVAPVRQGRLSGVQIKGETANGEVEEYLLGHLDGTIYHYEWQQGARLIGVYGTVFKDAPCAIGFAVDTGNHPPVLEQHMSP